VLAILFWYQRLSCAVMISRYSSHLSVDQRLYFTLAPRCPPRPPPPPLPSLPVLIALQERTKSQSWTCIQHSSFTTGFEICTPFVKGLKPEIQYHYQGNYGNEHLLCSLAEEYALKFQICMIVTIVQRYLCCTVVTIDNFGKTI